MRRRHPPPLLSLEEATRRLRPFARRHLGVRAIQVRQIVGTEGRGADFDRAFTPRRRDVAARLRQVAAAFPDGAYPPIVVHRLGEAYFVLDGHHRVAAARRGGVELIDADVTELRARWPLRADADAIELARAEQERLFMEESGLGAVVPDLLLRFTRPVGYLQLLDAIQLHGQRRMREEGRVLPPDEVAGDWYEREYLEVVAVIRELGFGGACPYATAPDVYLHAHAARLALRLERRCAGVADAARLVLAAA
jgi:hypothetical protein